MFVKSAVITSLLDNYNNKIPIGKTDDVAVITAYYKLPNVRGHTQEAHKKRWEINGYLVFNSGFQNEQFLCRLVNQDNKKITL